MTEFFNHLINCKDFDSAIIKGHLLTEYALDRYIEYKSLPRVDISELRFSYSTKMEVAKILGLSLNDTSIYNKLKLLNKLRNSIAHTLNFNEKVLEDFLNGVEDVISKLNLQKLKTDNEVVKFASGDNGFKLDAHHVLFCIQVAYLCGKITPPPSTVVK